MRLVGEGLRVERGERRIFDGVGFAVSAGQALVITGPNGSGKSTLLKAIAGFLPPAAGSIRLEGGGDAPVAEHCHYLAHANALKPQLTVEDNLRFWADFCGPGIDVDAALEQVGLPGVGDIPTGFLSAGQKRRVAIARLLAARRPVWLLDEPTAALDAASDRRFARIVAEHLASGGIAVAATHQPLGLAEPLTLDMTPFAGGRAA